MLETEIDSDIPGDVRTFVSRDINKNNYNRSLALTKGYNACWFLG